MRRFMVLVGGFSLMPAMALAQVFPVDQVTIDATKADLLTWAVAIIGVALAIFAYRRVKSIVR